MAVVVNELAANRSIAQEDGSETFVPILSEERLVSLIEGAVGYSADRGDSVAVSISPFLAEDIIEISIPWYENEAIRYWARIVLIFASLVLFLMIAVRPLVGRLVGGQVMGVTFGVKQTEAKGGKSTVVESLDELTDELSEEEAAEAEEMMDAGESLEEIKKKIQTKKSRISADMLDTANSYDDKVAVVRLLVGEDVGRVANVFKKMIKV